MEISPGCQMGMNFKTIRTACSAYSYPNSLHLSFSVFQHTFLVKLLANGSTFLVFWADETFLISEIIFFSWLCNSLCKRGRHSKTAPTSDPKFCANQEVASDRLSLTLFGG